MSAEFLFFSCFLVFVIGVLALDLGIMSRHKDHVSFREATIWTFIWVSCALIFFLVLKQYGYLVHGIRDFGSLERVTGKYQTDMFFHLTGSYEAAIQKYMDRISIDFLTGYFIEYSLSADNLFVILLIFSSFSVPEKYYKRILFWGVLGAIVMRMLFIFVGSALISQFHWILYIFGAFLVFSGGRMLFKADEEEKIDTHNHPVVRFASRFFKVHPRYEGSKFFVRIDGKKMITPLFVVLLVVEFSDLIFAVDSVPAIFAVTKDPYIVFFSNIFAIMGLRSLFFLLSNIMHLFHYLKYGLALLLVFIGVKMLAEHWFSRIGFNNVVSLLVILGILTVSIALSMLFPKKKDG